MTRSAPSMPKNGTIAAILPAAGSGRRFGSHQNKLFATIRGVPIWVHSAMALLGRPEIGRLIVAVSESDRTIFQNDYTAFLDAKKIEWVLGGQERTDSVRSGLEAIGDDAAIEYVAIHDAARPLIGDPDLSSIFAALTATGAAILATPVTGTLKRAVRATPNAAGDLIANDRCVTVDRSELWVAQTPQVFRLDLLRLAYDRHRGYPATDDAQLVERIGHPVAIVSGSSDNIKITHPEDLRIAEAIMARLSPTNK
ncbi:2-C-methyl-D-erythritol 4-phosphate cytidylyltransferase [Novipirellula aureliae]|uniref:2-C-methyl-D-erythritol 4-phosphate cytidylyltransferase n=1 Tax=Novipirellula aureliae TaxID=2527966 RepID=A0A5C6DS02_9BACT|nr:2-C-methyl-D-erythritol 4-phosphate cytidylyltransferase [Novipirellula aureliae]TWU38944.1 2-C-methyl-D-erythritol 4-phosphate cytidylyltransferase [Novipirellula aureliae]